MTCYLYIASDSRMREYARDHDRITDAVLTTQRLSRRQVAMISWDGETVDALALMSRTRNSLTLKASFSLTDFFELEPVAIAKLLSGLAEPHRERLKGVLGRGGELPTATATELKRLLERDEEGPWTVLEKLVASDPSLWPEDREPIVAYEREAIGLALSLAGLDRGAVMKLWDGDTTRPFIASFAPQKALEHEILAREARVFGGWSLVADGLVGATRFEQRGRTLTVFNVNRSTVERALGCDLVYFIHEYDSFVLVQYKRLRRGVQGWEYRPNEQLRKELARMRAITSEGAPSAEPRAHRFGEDFCFLKLCKPEVEDPFSLEMAEGMYLPLGLWDKLESSEQLLGPRGGTVVTYENVDRYLTNTNFIALVERAWIGSCNLTSKQIAKVVDGKLKAGDALVLAASGGSSRRQGPFGRR
jgi:hypothetical protein